jgi:hypothetical protein
VSCYSFINKLARFSAEFIAPILGHIGHVRLLNRPQKTFFVQLMCLLSVFRALLSFVWSYDFVSGSGTYNDKW